MMRHDDMKRLREQGKRIKCDRYCTTVRSGACLVRWEAMNTKPKARDLTPMQQSLREKWCMCEGCPQWGTVDE